MILTISLFSFYCSRLLGINNNVDAYQIPSPSCINKRITKTTETTSSHPLFGVLLKDHYQQKMYGPLVLFAGGFEWEDPTESLNTNYVENPYKNPSLLVQNDIALSIDPARLLSPRLQGSNLYFIGMMGSGKSTIAQIIARRMGSYVFLDTDDIIEKAVGKTINEIFQQDGEDEFRNVESQVLSSVYAYVRCVISTGGGIVCRRDNWSKLQTGIVVWLDVSPDVIIQRLQQQDGLQTRPLLQTEKPLEKIQQILQDRIELYQNADVRIAIDDMNETTEMISNRVIRDIHDFIDTHPPAWKVAQNQQNQQASQ